MLRVKIEPDTVVLINGRRLDPGWIGELRDDDAHALIAAGDASHINTANDVGIRL